MKIAAKYRFCNSRVLFVTTALICAFTLVFSLMPTGALSFASSCVQTAYADALQESDQNSQNSDGNFDDADQNEVALADEQNFASTDEEYADSNYDDDNLDLTSGGQVDEDYQTGFSGDTAESLYSDSVENESSFDSNDSNDVNLQLDLETAKEKSLNDKLSNMGVSALDSSSDTDTYGTNTSSESNSNTNLTFPSGSGTEQDPYLVCSSSQFEKLRTIFNSNPNAYVKLERDVYNSSSSTWVSLDSEDLPFCGTFDGNNHTIYLESNGSEAKAESGLFSFLGSNACIKNLTIDADLYITEDHAGIFASEVKEGAKNVSIINCTSSGQMTCNGTTAEYGGFIGNVGNNVSLTLDSCTNNANLTSDNSHTRYAGGLIGYVCEDQINIKNCTNNAEVNATGAASNEFKYGLIVLQMVFMIVCGSVAANWDAKTISNILRNNNYQKNLKIFKKNNMDTIKTHLERHKALSEQPHMGDFEYLANNFGKDAVEFADELSNEIGDKIFDLVLSHKGDLINVKNEVENILDKIESNSNGFIDDLINKTYSNHNFTGGNRELYKYRLEYVYSLLDDIFDDISTLPEKFNLINFDFNSTQKNGQFHDAFTYYMRYGNGIDDSESSMQNSIYDKLRNNYQFWCKNNLKENGRPYNFTDEESWWLFINQSSSTDLKYKLLKESLDKIKNSCKIKNISIKETEALNDEIISSMSAVFDKYSILPGHNKLEYYQQLVFPFENAGKQVVMARQVWQQRTKFHIEVSKEVARNFRLGHPQFKAENIENYVCAYLLVHDGNIQKPLWFLPDDASICNWLYNAYGKEVYASMSKSSAQASINHDIELAKLWNSSTTNAFSVLSKNSSKNIARIMSEYPISNSMSAVMFSNKTNWVTGSITEIQSKLSNAASCLATGEGGLGGVHWNAYGGGMVGYCDGDESKDCWLRIENSANIGNVTGGNDAGGFIAHMDEYCVDIVSCSNSGSVCSTDNMGEPSSGGFIGCCSEEGIDQCVNIDKSLNMGTILSRENSGGFIGYVKSDGDLNLKITNCGSVGGIAATSCAGGFLGWENKVCRIRIENCYSYCVYDTTTLNTTQINWSWCPIPGLVDWTCPATGPDGSPGAFIGVADDNDNRISFSNCYYLDGNKPIGTKNQDNDAPIPCSDQLHKAGPDDFSQGGLTYKLNNGSVSDDAPFGQVIDDFSLGDGQRMYVPIPGAKAPVYCDTHSEKTIYTNYNPRTIELYQLEFFTEHASLDPAVSRANVKAGGTYEFSVTVDNAYLMDKVVVTSSGKETELQGEEIKSSNNSNNSKTQKMRYTLQNVTDNITINVKTKEFEPNKPQGIGNSDSPYLISDISELVWFMNNVNQGMSFDRHVKLTNDIDMSTYNMSSMLNETMGYSGTFDGDGHTISGIASNDSSYAFFKYIDGGIIKNLTLSGQFGNAAFADWAHNATFEKCTATGSVNSTDIAAGGICARLWGTENTFESCVNECAVSHSSNNRFTCAGGILGLMTDGTINDRDENGRPVAASFNQCINKGSVCSTSANDTHAAGIVAYVNSWNRDGLLNAKDTRVNIKCCENAGNIYGEGDQTSCGGIMGCIDDFDDVSGSGTVNPPKEERAQVLIAKTINTGNIGYDAQDNKKTVQDAGGIISWTYDHSLDITIDACIVDGKIWCPDPLFSMGSGCGGFIANGEYGNDFVIKNSYTTGHITSNHKNKGYFIGADGTPALPPWMIALGGLGAVCYFVGWVKDSLYGYAPDYVGENNYFVRNGTPNSSSKVNDKMADDWPRFEDLADGCNEASNSQLSSGELAYKINTDKDNPVFGQNIDMSDIDETIQKPVLDENNAQVYENGKPKMQEEKQTTVLTKQSAPCVIGLDSRKTVPVYKAKQGDYTFYTNYNNSAQTGEYTIKVNNIVGGYVRGKLTCKADEDLTITLSPQDSGYLLSEFKVDGVVTQADDDLTYTFKSINKDHSVDVKFINTKEPKTSKDSDNTYLISNVQEYKWYVDQLNDGKRYNAKLVNDIDMTNNSQLPQIEKLNDGLVIDGKKSDDENYKIYRDTNRALINTMGNATIENLDIVVNCSISQSHTAALCECNAIGTSNLLINNVNISGNMFNLGGNSAAYFHRVHGNQIKFTNCKSSVNISSNDNENVNIAAFIGHKDTNGKVIIENCSNSGDINLSASKGSYAAGAIAFVESEGVEYEISGFSNSGNITANESAGGVFGEIDTTETKIDDSHDYKLSKCINSGKISAENAGGIIGAITDTETATVSIKLSENSGDIYSIDKDGDKGEDGNSGGIIGYVNDWNVNVVISGCAVTCSNITSDGEYAGGFIGCVNRDDKQTYIEHSFVYCPNIKATEYNGFLIGCNDDDGQKANDVFVGRPNNINMRLTGDENDKDEWGNGVTFKSVQDFYDGSFAVNLNSKLKSGNEKEDDAFGQIIDLDGKTRDACPHINGQKIYQFNDEVNGELKLIFSNYTSEQHYDRNVLSFKNLDPSKGTVDACRDVLVKNASDFTINFVGYNGYSLESLKVNGQTVTDKEVYRTNQYTLKNMCDDTIIEFKMGYGQKPDGSGIEDDPYKIFTKSELLWITRSINNNTNDVKTNCFIEVENDIDMSGISWQPIKQFTCNLYGKVVGGISPSIYNLEGSGSNMAFIDQLQGGSYIHDIDFNVNFSGSNGVGGLAIVCSNCTIKNVKISGSLKFKGNGQAWGPAVGGLCAYAQNKGALVENCVSKLEMTTNLSTDYDNHKGKDADVCIGGFVGDNRWASVEDFSFHHCVNLSTIKSNNFTDYVPKRGVYDSAGGFVGRLRAGKINRYHFFHCNNMGSINGDNAGGFVGNLNLEKDKDETCELEFHMCSNFGSVSGDDAGGFVGLATKYGNLSKFTIVQCMNYGHIISGSGSNNRGSNSKNAGGFVGTIDAGSTSESGGLWYLYYCGNQGKIETWDETTGNGGFVGEAENVRQLNIVCSYTVGIQDGHGWGRVGAFVGDSCDKDTLSVFSFYLEGLAGDRLYGGDKKGASYLSCAKTREDFARGWVARQLTCHHWWEIEGYADRLKGVGELRTKSSDKFKQVLDNYFFDVKHQDFPDSAMEDEANNYNVYELPDGTLSNFNSDMGDTKIELHTINVSVYGPGKVAPSGCLHKYTGQTLSITVKPNDGCVLEDLQQIDSKGKSESIKFKLDSSNTYTLENIDQDYTITATFSKFKKPEYDKNTNTYKVKDYNELLWVSDDINNGNTDVNIDIENDINAYNYGDTMWHPMGSTEKTAYKGRLDGKNHQISGLTIMQGQYAAMFCWLSDAKIYNLKLKNINYWLSGNKTYAAGLCSIAKGNTNIENVSIDGKINATNLQAGFIGEISGPVTIEACYTDVQMSNQFYDKAHASGGIGVINPSKGKVKISNFIVGNKCNANSNNEASGYKRSSDDFASGLIARVCGSGTLDIENSVNFANVKGMSAGGFIGGIYANDIKVNIINCSNFGRVTGNNCGGVLGVVDNISNKADVKLQGCTNSGNIGVIGAVIETAGGLVGNTNDKDINIDFVNCSNYGSVMNTKSALDAVAIGTQAGGFVLGELLFSSYPVYSLIMGTIAIGTTAFVASWAFIVIGFCVVVFGIVQTSVQTRSSIYQYAGGIIGEEDDCDKLTMKNVINVGAVCGTSHSHGIGELDKDGKCSFDNVYTLSSACKDKGSSWYDEEDYNVKDLIAFTSGEIGYALQENSKGEYGKLWYGQRIDFFEKGPRESVPTYTNNSTQIYKYGNVYTNLDRDVYKQEQYDLDISYTCPDDSMKDDSINTKFSVEVNGDRIAKHEKTKPQSTSSKDNIDKYKVEKAELITIKFQPAENSSSIICVEAYDKDSHPIKFKDNELVYNNDGSVDVVLSERAKQNRSIKVYCVDGGVHHDTVDGKDIMMLPWNSSDKLPTTDLGYHCNNYYLTKDIKSAPTWNSMEGDVNICLDGHMVAMEHQSDSESNNQASININNETSNVHIFDCNNNKIAYKYKQDSKNQIEAIQIVDEKTKEQIFKDNDDSKNNNSIDTDNHIIKGGVIHGLSEQTLIYVQQGALSIDNVTLISDAKDKPVMQLTSPRNTVDTEKTTSDLNSATANNTSNEASMNTALQNAARQDMLDGKYGAEIQKWAQTNLASTSDVKADKKVTKVENNVIFNASILNNNSHSAAIVHKSNGAADLAPLTLGKRAKFVNNIWADIDTQTIVNFADDFEFAIPINVISDVDNLVLTNDFDKYIKQGIDYRIVMTPFDSTKVVALGGTGQNANEIVLIDKNVFKNTLNDNVVDSSSESQIDGFVNVSVTHSANGNVYPCNSSFGEYSDDGCIKYVPGSDIKLHLATDKFNNVDKIDIKRNGRIVKTYDCTFDSDTLIYNGEIDNISDGKNATHKPIEAGEEISIDVAFKPQIESVLEGQYTPWISKNSLPTTPGKYILQNDVDLGVEGDGNTQVWEVPAGVFTIDLNGHKIKQNAAGKNAIHVTNDKTVLTFTDSTVVGKQESEIPTSMYVQKQKQTRTVNSKKVEFETFQEVSKAEYDNYVKHGSEDEKIYEVKGGAICGANVEPQSYYAYKTKAGAIVVDDGVFYMHAGNITANNAGALHLNSGIFNDLEHSDNNQGVEGGAALTINDDAYAFVYNDANIAYNSITGDKDYKSTFFSAGIASRGSLENYGKIYNNMSYDLAASAVEIDKGQFKNTGSITNNECRSNSFGAVYNAGQFKNTGIISDNLSQNDKCGVVNSGSFTVDEKSNISNNKYYVSKDGNNKGISLLVPEDAKYSDIYLLWNSVIEVSSSIQVVHPSTVVLDENRTTAFTKNWPNVKLKEDALFTSGIEDTVTCMDNTSELTFAKSDQTAHVSFDKVGSGEIKILGNIQKNGTYIKGIDVEFEANAQAGWSIGSVTRNDSSEIQPSEYPDDQSSKDQSKDASMQDQLSLQNATYRLKNIDEDADIYVYFESDRDRAARGDTIAWRSRTSLPKEGGKYILLSDVELTDTWLVPEGDVEIDLNGYNIVQTSANKSVICVNNAKTNLTITDSDDFEVQTFSKLDDNKYVCSDFGTYKINGGYIGGCQFSENPEAGAIVVYDGKFVMNGGSIAGNYSENSTGASALYVAKVNTGNFDEDNPTVYLSDKVNIAYNAANNFDSKDDKLLAAGINACSEVTTEATIHNNYGLNKTVGAVCVQGSSSWLVNKGTITNNFTYSNSVSGIYAHEAKFIKNIGSIKNNEAYEDSVAAVKCANTPLLNGGIIADNRCDSTSVAGISFYGQKSVLNLKVNSKIHDNKYFNNAEHGGVTDSLDLMLHDFVDYPITIDSQYANPASQSLPPMYIMFANSSLRDFDNFRMYDDFVKDFEKLQCNISDISNYFASADNKYVVSYYKDNKLDYCPVENTVTLNFVNNPGGSSNYNGKYVLTRNSELWLNYDAKALTEEGYKLGSVNYGKNQLTLNSNETASTVFIIKDAYLKDMFGYESQKYDVITTFELDAKHKEDMKIQSMSTDYTSWTDKNYMPTESGTYKLNLASGGTYLDKTWVIPENTNITIDLNGSTLQSSCEGALAKISKNSQLNIYDSKKLTHKFKKLENGRYKLAESRGDIAMEGGLVLGHSNSESTIAFDVDKDAELSLNGINVIGFGHVTTQNQNSQGSSAASKSPSIGGAIHNAGKLTIDEKSSISGNIADVAGAVHNDQGTIINNGKISDNIGLSSAAGIYNSGVLTLGQTSQIYDNKVLDAHKSYKVIDSQDIVQESANLRLCPQIVVNDKFKEEHKSYVSTSNGSWFSNSPFVVGAIKAFGTLDIFSRYFDFSPSCKLDFFAMGQDVGAK